VAAAVLAAAAVPSNLVPEPELLQERLVGRPIQPVVDMSVFAAAALSLVQPGSPLVPLGSAQEERLSFVVPFLFPFIFYRYL
jgi:hypothetical protein